MDPLHRIRTHPLLVVCTTMLLMLGILGAALYHYYSGQLAGQQAQRYGQALASSGAARAIEPTLTQDMISLQVILQSLANQPDVAGATIHDVENRLLVQSGLAPGVERSPGQVFTSPITLDEHIAGYLTVILKPASGTSGSPFMVIWWGAVLLSIIGLWLGSLVRFDRPAPLADDATESYTEADGEQLPDISVLIALRFINIDVLRQQLSREGFNDRLKAFDKQLSGILALYEGQRTSMNNDTLMLSVTGDSEANAAFYALCICQLAFSLNHQSLSPRLQLTARIMPLEQNNSTSLTDAFSHNSPSPGSCIHLDAALLSEQIHRQASIDQSNMLQSVNPPYNELLQRQLQQLGQL